MKLPQNGERRRWLFSLAIIVLFAFSTIIRLLNGQVVDERLCWTFVICFGVVFGASNIKDLMSKK